MKSLIILITVFLCNITSVMACLCITVPVSQYLQANDTLPDNEQVVVVKGKVLRVDVGDSVYNKFGPGNIVNIEVEEYWPAKGLKYLRGNIITVFNDENDCLVNFKKDSSYLIRAYSFNRYLATSLCEGTILISKAGLDLKILGQGSKPKMAKIVEDKGKRLLHFNWILIISLMINLILMLFIIRKKMLC